MIIRAAYDNAGLGMTKEPAQLDIVRTHMKFFWKYFSGIFRLYTNSTRVVCRKLG